MKQNPLTKILSFLRAKPMIGGLEIADNALRFVVWDGKIFKMTGIRLAPGIVVGGQIKDKEHFVQTLRILHDQILGKKKKGIKVNVIISLSSIGIYTQIFTLPFIEGESLEKAVQLNIQMISPLDFAEAYSGWQFANKNTDKLRLEILSAFANRGIVDEFVGALQSANFLAVAVESRALSLARLLKEAGAGFNKDKACILMSVDGSGLDFLVIRHGQLHFDYFNSWRDIQGEAKEISGDVLRISIIKNLHQVLNFYNSHWQEPIDEIILTTTGFYGEIVKIVEENFSLRTRDFVLNTNQSVAPDWFVALGSAARGLLPRRSDKDISLLGIDAQEEFSREQILGFLRFWRVLLPSVIAIFLLAFLSINFFLTGIQDNLDKEVASGVGSSQAKEIKTAESQIANFNRELALLSAAEASITLKAPMLRAIYNYAASSNLTLGRIYYQSAGTPVLLTGSGKSQDDLLNFKKMLEQDPLFSNVSLPLANVKVTSQGVDFSLTFSEGAKK